MISLSLSWSKSFLAAVFPIFSHPAGVGGRERAAAWMLGCWLGPTHHHHLGKRDNQRIARRTELIELHFLMLGSHLLDR